MLEGKKSCDEILLTRQTDTFDRVDYWIWVELRIITFTAYGKKDNPIILWIIKPREELQC